jgi:hypothetical protein
LFSSSRLANIIKSTDSFILLELDNAHTHRFHWTASQDFVSRLENGKSNASLQVGMIHKGKTTEEVRFVVVKTKTFEKEWRQSNEVSNALKARMASDVSPAPPHRALCDPARLSTSPHTKDCGKS